MSDFFKSAIGYFNAGPNGGADDGDGGGGGAEDDFVGQIVEVGSVKLHVKRLIAEGMFFFECTVVGKRIKWIVFLK